MEVESLQEAGSSGVAESEPLVRALSAAVRDVTGLVPDCALCPGLLESGFYAEVGVPAVAHGPGELELAHGPEESVALGRLVDCARIFALTARRMLYRR